MNTCIRCNQRFEGRWPKSKVCKVCSKRGAPRGKDHWNYKTGGYLAETIRREFKQAVRYCEKCSKDLIDATHYEWALHHKDHNHFNNDPANWQLLCKQCHQIEHECWLAFRRVA